MSPLSNNKLFLDYHRNPFIKYFSQVRLCTCCVCHFEPHGPLVESWLI